MRRLIRAQSRKAAHAVRSLGTLWRRRKIYKTFAEMPDLLVAFLGASSAIVASFYSYVLTQVMPSYMHTANTVALSRWGWLGFVATAIVGMLALLVWHFSSIALQCNTVLRARWYK